MRLVAGLIGISIVIFVSFGWAGWLREIIWLLRRGILSHLNDSRVMFDLTLDVGTFFIILLVFGLGAALMRAKFSKAAVWRTVVCFAIFFSVLGVIMGMVR